MFVVDLLRQARDSGKTNFIFGISVHFLRRTSGLYFEKEKLFAKSFLEQMFVVDLLGQARDSGKNKLLIRNQRAILRRTSGLNLEKDKLLAKSIL